MNEQQLAQRFLSAVAAEPPLGFNPDDVIDRAILRRRRRRLVLSAAAAAVVVMLGAVAVLSGAPRIEVATAPYQQAEPTTPSSPVPSDKHATPRADEPGFPGSAEILPALQQVGPVLLAEHAPGITFGPPDGGWHADASERAAVGAYPVVGTKHRYVTLSVWHVRQELDLRTDVKAHDGAEVLLDTVRQDGSHLKVFHSASAGTEFLAVVHYRLDGVIAQADTTIKPEPGRSGLPVDQQVLTALATDPRLTF